MTTATIIGSASTQSRGKRPGRPVTTRTCFGVYEYSTDGRRILSWPMGQYGPLLGFPADMNPLTEELNALMAGTMRSGAGSLGSYAPGVEQALADKLATLYAPYLRSQDIGIRFFSNGTDATQAAVALARHATGRDLFVSVGYHGGSSPTFTFNPQNGGVIREESEKRYDVQFGVRENVYQETAGSIVEVPSVEDEKGAADYLDWISNSTAYMGYFILDDIVTGFRYAPAGALEYYSKILGQTIQADFICLGKALSTYGKVSALLGPRDIMEALSDKVFASFTYNDHPLGFYDALWTLEQYEKYAKKLYGSLMDGHILYIGQVLKLGLNKLFLDYNFPAKCIGHPARSAIVPEGDTPQTVASTNGVKLNRLLARVVDEHDILLHRPNFVTLAHCMLDVEITLEAVEKVLSSWQK